MIRVLLVAREAARAKDWQSLLRRGAFLVTVTDDEDDARAAVASDACDLVFLAPDIAPAVGSRIVGACVRTLGGPLALVAIRSTRARDRVRWLGLGADECVSVPCDEPELLARAAALSRRRSAIRSAILRVGALEIDTNLRSVRREGREVALTRSEFTVLAYLAARGGCVVGTEELRRRCCARGSESTRNAVQVLISTLRQKLRRDGEPPVIQTRRGGGYFVESTASGSTASGRRPPSSPSAREGAGP